MLSKCVPGTVLVLDTGGVAALMVCMSECKEAVKQNVSDDGDRCCGENSVPRRGQGKAWQGRGWI